MPGPLQNGNVLQLSFFGLYQSQRIINTWNLEIDQFEPEDLDYEEYVNALIDDFLITDGVVEKLQDTWIATYTVQEVRVQKVYPTRERAVIRTVTALGAISGTGAPANVAAVVTKQGDAAGRFAQGSWHHCGVPSASLTTTGGVAAGYADDIKNALQAIVDIGSPTGFDGSTAQSVLWSPKVPARKTPITNLVAQSTSRVMRRRTVGVGI